MLVISLFWLRTLKQKHDKIKEIGILRDETNPDGVAARIAELEAEAAALDQEV